MFRSGTVFSINVEVHRSTPTWFSISIKIGLPASFTHSNSPSTASLYSHSRHLNVYAKNRFFHSRDLYFREYTQHETRCF
jgi:hypothetical protein